jgi:hypothetical protein
MIILNTAITKKDHNTLKNCPERGKKQSKKGRKTNEIWKGRTTEICGQSC